MFLRIIPEGYGVLLMGGGLLLFCNVLHPNILCDAKNVLRHCLASLASGRSLGLSCILGKEPCWTP